MAEKRQRGRPRSFHGPGEATAVQSLDRALRILAIVAESDGLSLSEIAAQSGIAASTAYRMLTTLESHGMVEFDPADQLWSVGVQTYRLGAAFLRRRKLVDRARIVMQELMEKTGETANLGVAEENCVVFVSQVETHQAIRAFFRPGTRSPFHASGIGKAILAQLPPGRVAAILAGAPLETFTDRTLATPPALARDLERNPRPRLCAGRRGAASRHALHRRGGLQRIRRTDRRGLGVGADGAHDAGARGGARPAGRRSGGRGDADDRRQAAALRLGCLSAHARDMAKHEGERHEAGRKGEPVPVELGGLEHPDEPRQHQPGEQHQECDQDEADHGTTLPFGRR